MGTAKRARQKAGRQARLEALAAAQKKQKQKRVGIRIAVLLVVFIGAAFLLAQVFGDDDTEDATALNTTTTLAGTTTTLAPATTGATANTVTTVPGATITGDTPCPATDGSETRTVTFEKAPPTCIDAASTYTAVIETTEGTITAVLDDEAAPLTVNNFVVLARYHFYDGIYFHRIVTDFVNQAGDPLGVGTGGPGYTFADELPTDASAYKVGTLAMANSGPDTNGSQIFMVVSEGKLSADYSVFGQITEGLDVMNAINALGSVSGEPTRPVQILSVTIEEG